MRICTLNTNIVLCNPTAHTEKTQQLLRPGQKDEGA